MRSDNKSNAARVAGDVGSAERIADPAELETPDADLRSEEAMERLRNPGSTEARNVTAEDVAHDDQDIVDDSQE
jgi:hypothetical protein